MDNPVYSYEALAALPIHASAVQTAGGALLFLGPAETGKSTVRQLLEPYLPALADDVVCLLPRPEGGYGVAAVSNWALLQPLPASQVAELRPVPLRAVLRLYRAAEPRLQPLTALETCRHLTEAFFEVFWSRYCDVPAKKMAFARLARVAAATAGYHFYFNRSVRTAEMLAEAFRL